MCFAFEVYGDDSAREVCAGRCAFRARWLVTFPDPKEREKKKISHKGGF